jgi:hypothetical protein
MNTLRRKLYKPLLALLTIALLILVSLCQTELNRDREKLGLTRLKPLENAPPVLAFTTVALGGFRGLIANILWIRATELQDSGKYFEMVQLSDWITKLQPHFTTVWIHLAWNMSYNISIKFAEFSDRWLWVQRGIELLRDQALKYNPQEPLIYRELAWHFQHKIGAGMDDANLYYKVQWAREMQQVLGGGRPNYKELLHPTTLEASNRFHKLTQKYKMDPAKMKEVDEVYGPFDWRLPESHSVYWAKLALDKLASSNAKPEDLMMLRRSIYQSMQMALYRGRLTEDSFSSDRLVGLRPNLDLAPNVNKAYEQMMNEAPDMRDHIGVAHRNILRDIVYMFYTHNRVREAAQWFQYLGEKYPNKPLLEFDTNSYPSMITLDDYVIRRVQGDVGETSRERTTYNLEGLFIESFQNLALGEDGLAAGYAALAQRIWENYMSKIKDPASVARMGLDPIEHIRDGVLNQLLDPEEGLNTLLANRLRTKLGLPPATNTPPARPPEPLNPIQ